MRKKYLLTQRELGALVFWATLGVNHSNGGSFISIINTLVKYIKILNYRERNLCLGVKTGRLGVELIEKLNKDLKMKITYEH